MVNKVKIVRVRVPVEMWKKVSKVAIDLEVTKEQLVNQAIRDWLVKQEKWVKTTRKVNKVSAKK